VQNIDDARDFIENQLLPDGGNFALAIYEFSATVYRARLKGSFISTLLNGVEEEVSFQARPGKNRYHEMLRWIRQLTGYEDCYWFYILDDAEGKSTLAWVKKARFAGKNGDGDSDDGDLFLNYFQTQPATPGGAAYLGLMGESGKWLLLHTHYPEQEFEVAIHGRTKMCNDLCKLLHLRDMTQDAIHADDALLED